MADRIDPFAGFRFHADSTGSDLQDRRNPFANGPLVVAEFRALCKHNAVEVDDLETRLDNAGVGKCQHLRRVATKVGTVGIGKQLADVPQGGRSEYRVGDRVQQDIRIAVTDSVSIMRDLDATDPKWSTLREAVRIVANANPLVRRLGSLSWTSGVPG